MANMQTEPIGHDETRGHLVVENRYPWVGDPRFGRITIYVDGRRAGRAAVGGRAMIPLEVGEHSVRVRLRWYSSERYTVTIARTRAAFLGADIYREGSLMHRMLYIGLHPRHAMQVSSIDDVERNSG